MLIVIFLMAAPPFFVSSDGCPLGLLSFLFDVFQSFFPQLLVIIYGRERFRVRIRRKALLFEGRLDFRVALAPQPLLLAGVVGTLHAAFVVALDLVKIDVRPREALDFLVAQSLSAFLRGRARRQAESEGEYAREK